ncbi:hypothetical protein [Sorlinia euscelidii]|uniref:Uncharacterized protein n=1 Tax=Sorlinia euscelidii TaxID=3081148 RepID=A0ABU7U115_9PROT
MKKKHFPISIFLMPVITFNILSSACFAQGDTRLNANPVEKSKKAFEFEGSAYLTGDDSPVMRSEINQPNGVAGLNAGVT